MKVLVTGATGFIGSHLVEALRRRGDEVTALARSLKKAEALRPLAVRVIPGDLDDIVALSKAVEGQDVIYHVAGVISARSEAEFMASNRGGTRNLVEATKVSGTGPRFILVSSMAAGGPSPRGRPLKGEEPPKPVTRYGRSKLAAERVVEASDLPWTIVRPPMVYGPRDREVLKVFRLARLGLGPVFGDGTQELSAVHGADLADALIAAATTTRTSHKIYYACHAEVFTSTHFVRSIAGAMGKPIAVIRVPLSVGRGVLAITETAARITGQTTILTTDKANEFFQTAWTGDPGPLTRDSGWTAAHDLTAGLAETWRWYRDAGWV
ncbi:MAG: NAD-dependent epimerase/dehydratase family protein [Gemmatimonadales bacterium]